MFRFRTTLMVALLALGGMLARPSAQLAAAPGPNIAQDTALALLRQGGGSLVVDRDAQSGVPRFVSGKLPAIRATVSGPVALARAFFTENSNLFQMQDQATELAVLSQSHDSIGMDHVRFQQRYKGVDVFGAQLVAHLRGSSMSAIAGSYVPNLAVDTKPALTLTQAAALARKAVDAPDAQLISANSGLVIYAKGMNTLTWKIELLSMSAPGRWLVFVNAHSGRIDHRISMLETAMSRKTYTAGNGTSLPGTLVCSDSPADTDCGDSAAQAAHDNAKKVYDYYMDTFGRDSIDGNGMELISTVHYDLDYNNAFWNGSQMVYGDGDGQLFSPLSGALDVIAHELTHGVTEKTAGLVYEDEPGALNESMSDVMGMFAEASSTGAIDSQMGEDVWTPAVANDALRDMADPHKGNDFFTLSDYTCTYRTEQPGYCGQPEQMSEYAHYPMSYSSIGADYGGVHTNSGIPNKAAWLLSQGGSLNGITVTAIGRQKAEQIYYRLLTEYLTPYSGFVDARNNAIQSCTDLIGQFSITADDCAQVRAAWAAVGVGANVEFTHTSFLPLMSNGYSSTPALSGKITLNGAAVAGVSVDLLYCNVLVGCEPSITSVGTATTDSSGTYSFAAGSSIPSTDDSHWYRLYYLNPALSPDGRLMIWYSDDLSTYTSGESHTFDTFDIADVTFSSPNSGNTQSFPVTFSWAARTGSSDYYVWELYADDYTVIAREYFSLMHSAPTFTLAGASDPQLVSGSSLSGAYYWDAVVISPAGFGYTYNAPRVALSSSQQAASTTERRAVLSERIAKQSPLLP